MSSLREKIYKYVEEKYSCVIDYPWMRYPDNAVFRHEDNRKWYGLVMTIPRSRLGLAGHESVDVLNVKLPDALLVEILIKQDGFFPAYHMKKDKWLSIILDGTVPCEEVYHCIDMSYEVTRSKNKTRKTPVDPEF